MIINSFNYTDEHNKRIGTALFLGASILDHSCVPNATFSFHKGIEFCLSIPAILTLYSKVK